MPLRPDYDIYINSDGNIIISHTASNKKAYNFLEKNLDNDKIVIVFNVTQGPDSKHVSYNHYQWEIKNYTGLKDVIKKFSDKNDFQISKKVIEILN